jgi:glutathione S-transferase
MYNLYIANKNYSSWSLRPWVLLSELGIEFVEHMNFFKGGYGKNTEFLKFSPTGLVPCLAEHSVTVWDSLAIAEYVYEQHPSVWPKDHAARAWARAAAAEMHSGFSALRNTCSMNCGVRIKLREVTPALQKDLDRLEALWQDGLKRFGGPYLAGDRFTAVDAFFCPVAFRVRSYGLKLSPKSAAYVERLLDMESMQNWYEAALAEKARDPDHEAELEAAGDVIADYRAQPESV